jgi:hypothetical protein
MSDELGGRWLGGSADSVHHRTGGRIDSRNEHDIDPNGSDRRQRRKVVAICETRSRQHRAMIARTIAFVRHWCHATYVFVTYVFVTRVFGRSARGLARIIAHRRAIGCHRNRGRGRPDGASRTHARRQRRQRGSNNDCKDCANQRHRAPRVARQYFAASEPAVKSRILVAAFPLPKRQPNRQGGRRLLRRHQARSVEHALHLAILLHLGKHRRHVLGAAVPQFDLNQRVGARERMG